LSGVAPQRVCIRRYCTDVSCVEVFRYGFRAGQPTLVLTVSRPYCFSLSIQGKLVEAGLIRYGCDCNYCSPHGTYRCGETTAWQHCVKPVVLMLSKRCRVRPSHEKYLSAATAVHLVNGMITRRCACKAFRPMANINMPSCLRRQTLPRSSTPAPVSCVPLRAVSAPVGVMDFDDPLDANAKTTIPDFSSVCQAGRAVRLCSTTSRHLSPGANRRRSSIRQFLLTLID
jgi:hypothetical protein